MAASDVAHRVTVADGSRASRDDLAGGDGGTDEAREEALEAPRGPVPRHVAIIMDGNRRWARERGAPEAQGHAAGVDAIRPIVERARHHGVAALSVFAFSRENWQRATIEVQTLLSLLEAAISDYTPDLVRQGVRVRLLGRLQEVSGSTRTSIEEALHTTQAGTAMTLNVAFNYSARCEIVDAARRLVSDGIPAEAIDEEAIAARLYTSDFPELDLLIRTGGEQRVSNFLLWQAAYAELYFWDGFWPDFDPHAFDTALAEYARRSRRFGR